LDWGLIHLLFSIILFFEDMLGAEAPVHGVVDKRDEQQMNGRQIRSLLIQNLISGISDKTAGQALGGWVFQDFVKHLLPDLQIVDYV